MTVNLLRVALGLLAAVIVAAALKFVLVDADAAVATGEVSALAAAATSVLYVLTYGLPLAALAALALELVMLRHWAAQIAIGAVVALGAAHLSVRGEALTSPAFAGGALSALTVIAIGALSALVYWAIAGRYAGWRGNEIELDDAQTTQAFAKASTKARVEPCTSCFVWWAAASLALFSVMSWLAVDGSGLRGWLVTDAELHGKAALKNAGYSWATFRVDDDRGVIEGLAPDEGQKRAAYASVREALDPVTGFPGVLAKIENEAVARTPTASGGADQVGAEQLADAERREIEARAAIQEARIATEAARTAEAEAQRKADARAKAAEADIRRQYEQEARAERAEEDARRQAEAAAAAAQVETAAVETATREEANANLETAPQAGGNVTGEPPVVELPLAGANSCTEQDLALIESSRVHFGFQRFDIAPAYAAELDRLAASARACAPRPIQISGHADSHADSLFNRALGLQRAESIRDGLVARGVPVSLIVAKSLGATEPIDIDTGNGERALNRRAEFRLLDAAAVSRDATQGPDERAMNCESDLSGIMAQSVIYFPTASAAVSPESFGLINKLARAVQTCGSVIITVEGHSDKVGDANYNQGLSESRANTVREALVAAGADPTRLASRGFASSRPHDPSNSPQAFALNRRIEFKVSGKFTSSSTRGP